MVRREDYSRTYNSHSSHRRPILSQIWYKLRYGKNRGIYYGIIWVLFTFFVLPVIEWANQDLVLNIMYIFLIISAVIGFYAAYPIIMWIDKRLSKSYLGTWMRRVVSGILAFAGFALSFVWLLSFVLAMVTMAAKGSDFRGVVSAMALACTILTFFCGIGFFAGYLEYVFERESGFLVFTGRQRF